MQKVWVKEAHYIFLIVLSALFFICTLYSNETITNHRPEAKIVADHLLVAETITVLLLMAKTMKTIAYT